jgi:HSP20 family protein
MNRRHFHETNRMEDETMTNELAVKQSGTQPDGARAETVQSLMFTPRVDILESEDELLLLADLPGVKVEDVDIRFENGELQLHGRCAARQEGADYLLAEYDVGDFFRAFTITEEVDADKIAAELKNGVLTVHLPKSEKAKPKRIAVKGE